jgi:hypothetical protein
MKKLAWLFPIIPALLLATVAVAAPVDQGSGQPASLAPWRIAATTSTGKGVGTGTGYIAAGAPAATVAVSTSSNAAIGLTTGATYRVACNVPCFYRTGTGTPVALTSDAPLYGPAVDYIGLVPATAATAIAFVTASGTGTCVVSLITP